MKLLVSVRTVTEALAALEGGADLIDVKEPANGALGKADDRTIAEIAKAIAERAPLSVAMGELTAITELPRPLDCRFLKFGLAHAPKDWRTRLRQLQEALPGRVVPVAYAEGEAVGSPPIEEVAEWSIRYRAPAMLVDTCLKDGHTLLDHVDPARLSSICRLLKENRVDFSVAGSLGIEHLPALRIVGPCWLGVRGAVCGAGGRSGALDPKRVRDFREALSRAAGGS